MEYHDNNPDSSGNINNPDTNDTFFDALEDFIDYDFDTTPTQRQRVCVPDAIVLPPSFDPSPHETQRRQDPGGGYNQPQSSQQQTNPASEAYDVVDLLDTTSTELYGENLPAGSIPILPGASTQPIDPQILQLSASKDMIHEQQAPTQSDIAAAFQARQDQPLKSPHVLASGKAFYIQGWGRHWRQLRQGQQQQASAYQPEGQQDRPKMAEERRPPVSGFNPVMAEPVSKATVLEMSGFPSHAINEASITNFNAPPSVDSTGYTFDTAPTHSSVFYDRHGRRLSTIPTSISDIVDDGLQSPVPSNTQNVMWWNNGYHPMEDPADILDSISFSRETVISHGGTRFYEKNVKHLDSSSTVVATDPSAHQNFTASDYDAPMTGTQGPLGTTQPSWIHNTQSSPSGYCDATADAFMHRTGGQNLSLSTLNYQPPVGRFATVATGHDPPESGRHNTDHSPQSAAFNHGANSGRPDWSNAENIFQSSSSMHGTKRRERSMSPSSDTHATASKRRAAFNGRKPADTQHLFPMTRVRSNNTGYDGIMAHGSSSSAERSGFLAGTSASQPFNSSAAGPSRLDGRRAKLPELAPGPSSVAFVQGKTYTCYRCPAPNPVFDSEKDLEQHTKEEHQLACLYSLGGCKTTFSDFCEFRRHTMTVHIKPEQYKCLESTCDESHKLFARPDQLRSHLWAKHTPKDVKKEWDRLKDQDRKEKGKHKANRGTRGGTVSNSRGGSGSANALHHTATATSTAASSSLTDLAKDRKEEIDEQALHSVCDGRPLPKKICCTVECGKVFEDESYSERGKKVMTGLEAFLKHIFTEHEKSLAVTSLVASTAAAASAHRDLQQNVYVLDEKQKRVTLLQWSVDGNILKWREKENSYELVPPGTVAATTATTATSSTATAMTSDEAALLQAYGGPWF